MASEIPPQEPTATETATPAVAGMSNENLMAMAAAGEPPAETEKLYQILACVFFGSSILLFIAMAYYWISVPLPISTDGTEIPVSVYIAHLFPAAAMLVAGIICGVIGYMLINIAGATTRRVLPRQDYVLLSRLILDEKEKGIQLYIILHSLSGITGVFTKIGFSGLPLATMTLTIFLTLMSLKDERFSQMAQLTLGAFLGSFVERRQSGQVPPSPATTTGRGGRSPNSGNRSGQPPNPAATNGQGGRSLDPRNPG